MEAIETFYNGYRFRSRLEARWAVFMSTMFVPFQYEAEGFRHGTQQYLPDFWLPDIRAWVEVKPRIDQRLRLSAKEHAKVVAFQQGLAAAKSADRFFIVSGEAYLGEYDVYVVVQNPEGEWEVLLYGDAGWTECPVCGHVNIQPSGCLRIDPDELSYYCERCDVGPRPVPVPEGVTFDKGNLITKRSELFTATDRLKRAYAAARSARFA